MFIHKNQLEYVLTPDQYFSPEQHQVEMDRLFRPGWHIVAVKSDLPNHGDFLTVELLGEPIQVRNLDGEYYTFLNICSHRHCLLTKEKQGNSPSIRCQYHGWEYKEDGHTAKIPDAGCFRPFDRENARLKMFRTECCGNIIFANLSEEGPDLREYLGDFYDELEQLCSLPQKQVWYLESEFPCNWKLPVENTVETYHITCIHPKTFGEIYPSEENQTHVLDEKFSTLRYDHSEDVKQTQLQERVIKRLGGDSTSIYMHHLVHPNLVFTKTDLFMHVQVYLPVSPTTSKTRIWFFSLKSRKRNLLSRIIAWAAGRHGRKMNSMIQEEDKSVFESQQKGLESSRHRGCIGTREERIYVFQQYIKEACAGYHPEENQSQSHAEDQIAQS